MDSPELLILLDQEAVRVQKKAPAQSGRSKGRLNTRDLKLFAGSLSSLLEGGIPILRALEGLEKLSATNLKLRHFLAQVKEGIRQGSGFSKILEDTKSVPSFFSQIVYAGEVSGKTSEVLQELSGYLEKEAELKGKIREALAYPCFILFMGLATLGVLLQIVIPKLAGVYKDFGAELPIITRIILGLSDLFLPFAAVLLIFAVLATIFFLRKKEALASLIYKMPIAGGFFRSCVLIQFSRLLSLLLESGIPVLDALKIVEKTFGSFFLKRDITSLSEGLAEGRGFSNCLEEISWMDPLSKMLASSGEESGRLPASFSQIARDTQTRLESQIQMIVKLLEPGLILVIGLIVGFVVIGTVLPIFDISGLVR